MLLSVKDIVKRFTADATPILEGVSLEVDTGEVVALTGESGSGKSTLLHIIAGLETSESGSVVIDGADLASLNDRGRAALRRTSIGIVFQQFNLIPSLNARQNLSFQARMAGQSPSAAELESLAKALGIAEHLTKYPEELSGGQQQRVAIGRALMPRPRLLLADEPTGNLDEATSDAVFDLLIAQAREAGAGLLVVTHSQALAARADRQLHLSRGRLAA